MNTSSAATKWGDEVDLEEQLSKLSTTEKEPAINIKKEEGKGEGEV